MKNESRNFVITVARLVFSAGIFLAILAVFEEGGFAQAPIDQTTSGTSKTISEKNLENLPRPMKKYEELLKPNPQQRKGTVNDPIVEKGNYPGGRRETYDSSIQNETISTEYDKDNNVVERTEISRYPNGKPRRISTTVYYRDAQKETGLPQEKTETSAVFDERGNITGTTKREIDKNGNWTSDKSEEWKYDEQGRQIEHTIKEDDPNGFSKATGTRVTKKYSGDNDKKGTTAKEKIRRNERTGAWETEFGIPLEKPRQQQAEAPAREPQSASGPAERSDEIMISYPRVELFGGYSFTSEDGDPENTNLHGWNTSVAVNLNEHVAVRGDVSGFHRSEGNSDISKYLVVFGPQFSYRTDSRVRLFARPLFGFAHFKSESELPGLPSPISFSENAFAMAFGGGVDVRVNKHLMVRLGQFDYQPTFFGDARQDNFRFSAGLVFTFGGGNR